MQNLFSFWKIVVVREMTWKSNAFITLSRVKKKPLGHWLLKIKNRLSVPIMIRLENTVLKVANVKEMEVIPCSKVPIPLLYCWANLMIRPFGVSGSSKWKLQITSSTRWTTAWTCTGPSSPSSRGSNPTGSVWAWDDWATRLSLWPLDWVTRRGCSPADHPGEPPALPSYPIQGF